MSELLAKLAEPFPPELVSWRVGPTTQDKSRGQALCYLDARDVMRRFDDVFGPHWQCRYVPMPNGTTCCEIGVLIEGDWIWRSNGAGATDIEGEKGGYSDAFKRAAVLFGVGRYLYDLSAPWVALEQKGRSYIIAEHEMARLQALLRGEKPKSAYQARKDGDWKQLADALNHCQTPEAVSEFLRINAAKIAKMPDGWQGRWNELVEQTLERVNARVAA